MIQHALSCRVASYAAPPYVDLTQHRSPAASASCLIAPVYVKLDVVSYTTLMGAFARSGEWKRALELLTIMPSEGVDPNRYTYGAAITACAQVTRVRHARCFVFEGNAQNLGVFVVRDCVRLFRAPERFRNEESAPLVGALSLTVYPVCGAPRTAFRPRRTLPPLISVALICLDRKHVAGQTGVFLADFVF